MQAAKVFPTFSSECADTKEFLDCQILMTKSLEVVGIKPMTSQSLVDSANHETTTVTTRPIIIIVP